MMARKKRNRRPPKSSAPNLDPRDERKRSPVARMILLATLFASIFVARITVVNDQDVFMHIRSGEWIVEHGRIPHQDPFSFSAAEKSWEDHQWLYQVLAFGLDQLGGLAALGVVRAAIFTLAFFLLYLACRARGAGPGLSAALTLLASFGTWFYNEPRPYVVTPLGLALFALALERIRAGRRRWMLAPPLYMLAWVNMHAGFTAGCILLLIAFGGAAIDIGVKAVRQRFVAPDEDAEPLGADRRLALDYFYCGLLTLATVLCNPYGWRILLFPFRVVGHELFMRLIQEWNPSVLGWDSIYFYVFAFALGLRGAYLLVSGRRVRAADLAALVVFALMTLGSRRHVVLFFFVVAPIGADWLRTSAAWRRLRESRGLWRGLGWASLLGLAALWTIPVAMNARVLKFGLGYNHAVFPSRAPELIEEYDLKPNLFNGFNFGGYLIYRLFPDYKIFIDGRVDVYGAELTDMYVHIYTAREGWREALDAMGANVALLDTPVGDQPSLIDAMTRARDWVLVYWDDKCALFVRAIPEHRRIIKEQGFFAIHPLKTDGDLADLWSNAAQRVRGLQELQRRAQEGEPCAMAWRNLSYLYGRMPGDQAAGRALEAVNRYLELNPTHASMVYRKGQILERLGRDDQARRAYRRALDLRPGYAEAFTRLGALAQKEECSRRAEAWYRRAWRATPMDPVGAKQYAAMLMPREAWEEAIPVLGDYLRARDDDRQAWGMLAAVYGNSDHPYLAEEARGRAVVAGAEKE